MATRFGASFPKVRSQPVIGAQAAQAAAEGPQVIEEPAVTWSFDPPGLQVFRATAVKLEVTGGLESRPEAKCRWNFGDASPTVEGCSVSHTFHGGQADQVVTLQVHDGAWSSRSTRTIPLERLPVDPEFGKKAKAPSPEDIGALPPRPDVGAANLRFALVADTAAKGGVHDDVKRGLSELIDGVQPDLVIHVGGMVSAGDGEAGWTHVRSGVSDPLSRASLPLVTALSPADRAAGAQVPKSALQLVDGTHYPERYTFTRQGAFFLVFGASDDGVTEETLRWMRDQLGQARIYEARYVVSYLPLHKFGNRHLGSLDKRFRLYEIFLRSRVSVLFSAGYRVYFKGRYGALPIVSVGSLAGPGGKLSGVDFSQPASFVIVDQLDGVPERIFSVIGPDFDRTFDESNLPESVEVYTR